MAAAVTSGSGWGPAFCWRRSAIRSSPSRRSPRSTTSRAGGWRSGSATAGASTRYSAAAGGVRPLVVLAQARAAAPAGAGRRRRHRDGVRAHRRVRPGLGADRRPGPRRRLDEAEDAHQAPEIIPFHRCRGRPPPASPRPAGATGSPSNLAPSGGRYRLARQHPPPYGLTSPSPRAWSRHLAGVRCHLRGPYLVKLPASTVIARPVTYFDSSEARNSTAFAMSSGCTSGVGSRCSDWNPGATSSQVGFSTCGAKRA